MNILMMVTDRLRSRCARLLAASAGLALLVGGGGALAETLPAALARAYAANPDLQANRAALRAIDEEVAIARGGYRPTLSADGTTSWTDVGDDEVARGAVALQLDQPLFDGFRTRAALGSAGARVEAGRGTLAETEQGVLLAAATAYVDVLRDREIVGVREQNLDFLEQQVRSAEARLRIGDGTRTAVSQAEARRAQADAQIALARAELGASVARYRRVTGADPEALVEPELPEALLPGSLAEARERALAAHPRVRAAEEAARAAAFDVDLARGALLPTLGLRGRVERVDDDFPSADPRRQDGTTASVSLQLQVPIYTAGVSSARVRQQRQRLEQGERELESARDAVLADLGSAWSALVATRAAIAASAVQTDAASLARDGIVNERDVGLATQLDVLIAQQDVLDARVAAARADRDALAAAFSVLEGVGTLRAEALDLPVARYAPSAHFEAVDGQWYGTRARPWR